MAKTNFSINMPVSSRLFDLVMFAALVVALIGGSHSAFGSSGDWKYDGQTAGMSRFGGVLGNTLTVKEVAGGSVYNGTWTRRGGTDVFDAVWNGSVLDVIEIESVSGNQIVLYRHGNKGRYSGTLSPDGMRITSGTASWYAAGWSWSAVVSGRPAANTSRFEGVLGNVLTVKEVAGGSVYDGTWTRRGGTDVFDAVWQGSGRDVIEIESVSGSQIVLYRHGNKGRYSGALSADGMRITSGIASWYAAGWSWSAVVPGRPAAAPSAPAAPTQSPAPVPQSTPSIPGPGTSAPRAATPESLNVDIDKSPMPKDPLDPKQWPTGDVLWAVARPAAAAPPSVRSAAIMIPARLDFNVLSPLLYASAVSVAKEGMRLLQGPLTPDQQRKFDAKWAPYFNYPSPEIVDYLNKLNPLLARFLQARAGYNAAVQAFQKALAAAGASDKVADGHGTAVAMAGAKLQKTLMDGYYKAMAEAQAAIEALGPMPNPFEVRARRSKAFDDALAAVPPIEAPKPAASPDAEDYLVLQKIEVYETHHSNVGGLWERTFSIAEGLATGSIHGRTEQGKRYGVTVTAKWRNPGQVIKFNELDFKVPASVTVTLDPANDPNNPLAGNGGSVSCESDPRAPEEGRVLGNGASASGTLKFTGANSFSRYSPIPVNGATPPPEDNIVYTAVGVSVLGVDNTVAYRYRIVKLTSSQAAELKEKAAAQQAQIDAAQRAVSSVAAQQSAAARARAEALAYQREMEQYFARQRSRADEQMKTSVDPAVRKTLMSDFLAYDEHMHASGDSAAYLQTGEWQRTRTLYDAFNMEVMDRNAREESAKVREPVSITNSALRQIDLMPPELRDAVRQTWESQVTSAVIMKRDTATMKQAAGKVAQQVRAYWNGVSGLEQDKALVNDVVTKGLEITEFGAGVALLGVGGVAATGAGMTGAALWGAETLLGASYGGATGYVEGGVVEASRRSLQWAGTLGFVAAEAIDGYAQTGEISGAASRAATGFLIAKAAEVGIKWAAATAGKIFGAGPTGLEAAEVAEFGKGMEAGRQMVRNAEQAEWRLAEAVSKGARQAEVDRLTKEAEQRAAELNASWYAKFQLKTAGPGIAGNAFDQRISKVYEQTLPDFLGEMKKLGYDVSKLRFKPMRNPSSAGSVSMDLDLALVESNGLVITKAGRPVSRSSFQIEAQEVWNKAYQARTGQSAEQSLLNITTSMHKEAYTNKLRQENVPWDSLTPAEIAQATDAVRVKVSDISLPTLAKFVENARGLEKEMRTKFLPYLRQQITRAQGQDGAARAQALRKAEQYWTGIYDQCAELGKHENQPMRVWQLQQQLKDSTGGKTLWDVADALGTFWEGLAKFSPLSR